MSNSDIQIYAQRRLWISRIEGKLFKLSPQISLEIILVITANGGDISLEKIYNSINATNAAIRMHINSLKVAKIIVTNASNLDKRARWVSLTPEGIEKLNKLNVTISKRDRAFFKSVIDVPHAV